MLGWGTMREGGRPAKILRYVELPYVSLKECRRAMRPHRIYDSMVCAGYVKYGGKDACQVNKLLLVVIGLRVNISNPG